MEERSGRDSPGPDSPPTLAIEFRITVLDLDDSLFPKVDDYQSKLCGLHAAFPGHRVDDPEGSVIRTVFGGNDGFVVLGDFFHIMFIEDQEPEPHLLDPVRIVSSRVLQEFEGGLWAPAARRGQHLEAMGGTNETH